ncbi:hypothetical protein BKA93DRAFT_928252 [Sparassis latifolia]
MSYDDAAKVLLSRLSDVKLRDAALRSDHTDSVQTRPPSLYDRHLSPRLHISSLHVSSEILTQFRITLEKCLHSREHLLTYLKTKPRIADFSLMRISKGIAGQVNNEHSIELGLHSVFIGVLELATLAICDIKFSAEDQSTYQYLEVASSRKSEANADLIIQFHSADYATQSSDISPTFALPEEWLKLGPLYGLKIKNVLAIDPRLYLSLLLLSATFVHHKELVFPWCKVDCIGCEGFAHSHAFLDAMQGDFQCVSEDSNYEPGHVDDEGLRVAITRAVERIPEWDKVVGSHRYHIRPRCEESTGTTNEHASQETSSSDMSIHHDLEELVKIRYILDALFSRYDINDPTLQLDIKAWLRNAVWITIQAWSEMCRHDTTYHLVSSYQVSWVIHRNRCKRSATISEFFFPGDHIVPILTGSVVKAFEDAQNRASFCKESVRSSDPHLQKPDGEKRRRDPEDEGADRDQEVKSRALVAERGGILLHNTPGDAQTHLGEIGSIHLAFQSNEYQSTGFSHFISWEPGTTDNGSNAPLASTTPKPPVSTIDGPPSPTDMVSDTEVSSQIIVDPIAERAGLILDTQLSDGWNSITWEGSMILETNGRQIHIVAKVSIKNGGREQLLCEYKIYQHLQATACDINATSGASASPHCYGVFVDTLGTTVLVLNYAGRPLDEFASNDFDKIAVYRTAVALHNANVFHDDLEPRNVLIDDQGGVHIIDLETAWIGHKCSGPSCSELQGLQDDLGLADEEVARYFK